MASKIESSFGARFMTAKTFYNYLSTLSGYNPPNPLDTLQELDTLIQKIDAANKDVTLHNQAYTTATTVRMKSFKKDVYSIDKLMTLLKAAVIAQYGKQSYELEQLSGLVKQMRESTPSSRKSPDGSKEVKVSRSEKSFGSQLKYFKDVVSLLQSFSGYDSENPNLKLSSLQQFLSLLDSQNNAVDKAEQTLSNTRKQRRELYEDFKNRATRAKYYLKSKYGTSSSEYAYVLKLRF